MSAGIDWSLGTANYDAASGIHYGVMPQQEMLQAWADSSAPVYAEDADEDAEPVGFVYKDDEYLMQQGADDGDVFVLRSPYMTRCRYCSPCAPGAGYLLAQDDEGIWAFCPGPDWYDAEQLPMAIYRVSDGSRVADAVSR